MPRLPLLFAALAFAACGDRPDADAPAADTLETDALETAGPPASDAPLPADALPYFVLGSVGGTASTGTPRRVRPSMEDSVALQAFLREMRDEARDQLAFLNAFDAAEGWREADALVRQRVGPDSLPSHDAAARMLDRHLLRGPLDADKAEALGRYTSALLAHRTDEGALMLWALLRLEGRWEDGRRRSAARATAARLGGAYAAVAECVDCTVDEALDGMWPEARRAAEGRLRDMATVHRELMTLARSGTPTP